MNSKRVAIVQSNYIPWKGYFDLIASVDEFILLDDVQFTKRDWRNRNMIKTPNGLQWLTIPVESKGKYDQKIFEVKVSNNYWADKHWQTIKHNYGKAKFYDLYAGIISEAYSLAKNEHFLSSINFIFIKIICDILAIDTKLSWSRDYKIAPELDKNKRLLDLCIASGATHYVSGPAARVYMNAELFKLKGISVDYFSYTGYKQYNQLYQGFEHRVSIVDLLFNTGYDAEVLFRSEYY